MLPKSTEVVKIFYCYARKDRNLRDELEKHLFVLKHQGKIRSWHDREILPGASWEHEVDAQLGLADIVLLLISPDFIASNYCYGIEMQRALERHSQGDVYIIPILLRPCYWEETPISQLQLLPTGEKAITSWQNRDEAFKNVTRGIVRVVDRLLINPSQHSDNNVKDDTERKVVSSPSINPSQPKSTYSDRYTNNERLAKGRLWPIKGSQSSKKIITTFIAATAIIIAILAVLISGLWSKFIPVNDGPISPTANLKSTSTPHTRPTLTAFLHPFEPKINALYMVWKGTGGDQTIYWANSDGSSWSAQQYIPAIASSNAPSLAVFQNRPYIVWKGIEGDQTIYWANFDGSSWSAQRSIPALKTSDAPKLAVFQDKLYMIWKGIEGDQKIYWASFNGSNWSARRSIPNALTSNALTLAIFQGKLYIAWKTRGGDQRIFEASFDGSRWSAQQHISTLGTSNAPTLATFQGKLYIAWKGIEGDPRIYWANFDGSSWSVQRLIPAIGTSTAPSLATF